MKKDIFISYKNDNAGNNFATRLKDDLEAKGYSVYFNPDENHSGHFPDRLRAGIEGCKDFILILSDGCLAQLMSHNKIDWIREELLMAYNAGKHIIPIIMDGVSMPADKDVMPADLQFLPGIDAISMPEQYMRSPFDSLTKTFMSRPEKNDVYRDVYNSNSDYNVCEDFSRTKKAAEGGDLSAMYELANMYYYGFSDEQGTSDRNFEKAYDWFRRLTLTESEYTPLANAMIAKMYYRGIVPRERQSYEKALSHYKKAAHASGYSAQQTAYMTSRGIGCEFDFETAEQQYLSVIDRGDSVAYHDLADMYIRLGKHREAAELYKRIIDKFPRAEYKLACLYMNGVLNDPPKPDFYRAAFHFQHIISHGECSADVYYQLARLYFCPTGGFPQDFKIAQEYYKTAADMGDVDGQYMVAYMYEHGHVVKDIEKAIHYHTLAAEQGHIHSPTHLSMLYQLSEFQNYHKAFKYAKMAASLGEKEGEFIYANLLYFGRGCEADPNRAYEMYERAYNHGIDQAKFMMDKIKASS